VIWLTWRQFRVQAMVVAVVLVAFAVALGLTGPNLAHLYTTSGLGACQAPRDCSGVTTTFLDQMKANAAYPLLYVVTAVSVLLLPALIGAFWGAPLITREVEAHTLRVAWYQGVTPTQWTAMKLGLLGLVSVVSSGLLSLMVTWWANPIEKAGGFPVNQGQFSRFSPQIFDARGVAPLAYALFAFVLGVTVGVIVKRTVAAMAITLVIFALVQVIVPTWVRPNLFAPAHLTSPVLTVPLLDQMVVESSGQLTVPVKIPNAWIVSNQTVTASGQVFTLPVVDACQNGTHDQCVAWLAKQNLRQQVTYQPASRYWQFQWYETGIFVALSLLLAALCVLLVKRGRLSA
jgi:hypothetical protein